MPKAQPYVPQSLGERIAHARRQLGVFRGRDILAPDLAKLVGVSAESVYNWESGETKLSPKNRDKLAVVLGVPPEYIEFGIVRSRPRGGAHHRRRDQAEGDN